MYARWQRGLPPAIAVHAIELPGRGRRYGEDSPCDLRTLASWTASAIAADADRPVALFGHSFGAVLAYETAVRLAAHGIVPSVLVASAASCPARPAARRVRNLDEEAFTDFVGSIGGVPAEIWDFPEARELFLLVLRHDLVALDEYSAYGNPPLACPIVLFSGEADRSTDVIAQHWARLTTAGCTERRFPGDHFFVRTAETAVLNTLVQLLLPRV
jgi:surfactin synthase thioesterase subunit